MYASTQQLELDIFNINHLKNKHERNNILFNKINLEDQYGEQINQTDQSKQLVINHPKNNLTTNDNKLKIGMINTAGLRNNVAYVNMLATETNILLVMEHWIMNYADLIDLIYVEDKSIIFKAARKNSKLGRPSSGTAFIIDKNLKISNKFYSDRISVLSFEGYVIISAYMVCDTNKQKDKFQYDLDLALIEQLKITSETRSDKVIIMGDLNTDMTRLNSHHTNSLNNFIFKNNLTLVDIFTKQPITYTYSKITNNHISRKPDKITKKKYQFNSIEFILELKSRIEKGVCTLDYQLKAMVTDKDREKVKLKLTELTNQLVSILHDSAEKAMNE